MPFCTECGKPIPENAKFCRHCGAKVELDPAAQPQAEEQPVVHTEPEVSKPESSEPVNPEPVASEPEQPTAKQPALNMMEREQEPAPVQAAQAVAFPWEELRKRRMLRYAGIAAAAVERFIIDGAFRRRGSTRN